PAKRVVELPDRRRCAGGTCRRGQRCERYEKRHGPEKHRLVFWSSEPSLPPAAGFDGSGERLRCVAIEHRGAAKAQSAFERHGLSDEQLVAILRTMVMQRTLENRGFQLNRQGKIPFASASEGHEGVQAGAAMAFERGKDIFVPYYRDLGLDLGIGLTPYEVLLSLFARADDHSSGRQFPHHYASRRLGLQ